MSVNTTAAVPRSDVAARRERRPQSAPKKAAAREAADAETALKTPVPLAHAVVEHDLPPGAMMAAAVIAGRLPERPETSVELALRYRNIWKPPQSDLRLRDRLA